MFLHRYANWVRIAVMWLTYEITMYGSGCGTFLHIGGLYTALGAEIYVIARAIYLPVYIVGIPCLRTLIYVASLWSILQMLEAVLY